MKLATKWHQPKAAEPSIPIPATGGLHQDNQDNHDHQDSQDIHDGGGGGGGGLTQYLPTAPEQTDKLLWKLARHVKNPNIELPECCRIFDDWKRCANPAFLDPKKDYLAEFLRKLGLVKHPKGATLLSALHGSAVRRACRKRHNNATASACTALRKSLRVTTGTTSAAAHGFCCVLPSAPSCDRSRQRSLELCFLTAGSDRSNCCATRSSVSVGSER